MKSVSHKMRSDWDRRAQSEPLYYVALGPPGQAWQDFVRNADELVRAFEIELRSIRTSATPETRRALEIGCGPGRLMLPLSQRFGEIHGVDVSPEMVRLAQANLAGVAHAHVHATDGTELTLFDSEFFDFVYSYAVFQHIPSREVVMNYLKETRRVLKIGGVARMQFNGLSENAGNCDTWAGVRFEASDITSFAREHELQLLALEGAGSRYMWATLLKRSVGWYDAIKTTAHEGHRVVVRRITTADSSARVVPASGPYAAFSLWIEGLPSSADLNTLRVEVENREARLTCVTAHENESVQQVCGMLPQGLEARFHPVRLIWAGKPLGCKSFLRVVPAGPEIPRIVAITDATYVGAGRTISTNAVRVRLQNARRPEDFRAKLDGQLLRRASLACTSPDVMEFEVVFQLPRRGSGGTKQLECWLGWRYLGLFELFIDPRRPPWRTRLKLSRFGLALGRFLERRRRHRRQ